MLSSPLIRVLRASTGPAARLDFVVKKEFAELVKFNPHISVVHEFNPDAGFGSLRVLRDTLRAEHYDLVVDIHGSLRSVYLRNFSNAREVVTVDKRLYERWQLVHLKRNIYSDSLSVADRYMDTLREFGIHNDGKGLELFVPDATQFSVSGRMAKLRLNEFDKVIGVCPGAKHFTKRWQQEKFAEVCGRLAEEKRAKVLIFGGVADRNACAAVASLVRSGSSKNAVADLAGQFTLLEVAAAMDHCDLVLTNDSGPMHIACARHRKVVAIFGSTVREFGFAPYGTDAVLIENASLRCRPCSHIGRAECPKGHFKCMNGIGVDDVYRAALKMLEK